jgi:hypothetical protein
MSIIYCNINLFDLNQKVYINDNTNQIGQVPIESLDHFIVTMCAKHNIDNVILTGSNYYTLPVKNRIEKEAISRYNKKIKVEVK